MKGYMRGNVNEHIDVFSLAAETLLSAAFDETVTERALISSLVASWAFSFSTPTVNAGPYRVGVAHSDYTSAEIEEWIEATATWDVAEKLVSKEIGRRLIREVGVLHAAALVTQVVTLNDGKPIRTKLNWILNTEQTIRVWIYNMGSAASAAETAILQVEGYANLWQK